MEWRDYIMKVDAAKRIDASKQEYMFGKMGKIHLFEMFRVEPPEELYENNLEYANTIKDVAWELRNFYQFYSWQILDENLEEIDEESDCSNSDVHLILTAFGSVYGQETNKSVIVEMMNWNGYHAQEETEVTDELKLTWTIISFNRYKEVRALRRIHSYIHEEPEPFSPEGTENHIAFEPENFLVATSVVLLKHSMSNKLGGIVVFRSDETKLQIDSLRRYLKKSKAKDATYAISNVFTGSYTGTCGERFSRESITLELYGIGSIEFCDIIQEMETEFGISNVLVFDANRDETYLIHSSVEYI